MKGWSRREFVRALGLGAGTLAIPGAAQAVRRRPNIIFILIDDMGWMDSTVYGSRYYDTPNVERLARRGVTFTQAYAANPFCSPTRASILTGKYPARLGITTPAGHLAPLPPDQPLFPEEGPPWQQVVMPESQRFLPLKEWTIAEVLKEAGYRTGFIGKWHLGQPEEYWPQHQGFDLNIGGGGYPGPPSYFSPYRIKPLPDGPPGEYIADRLTDEAVKFIEEHQGHPFLLFLWHYSVHAPFQAKDSLTQAFADRRDPRGKQDNPTMASMLKSMDESIGRLLDKLEELALSDDTVIFFYSDNGGNEYDRVGPKEWLPTNNDPLRSGKGSLYEGGTRVPMIVCWPGVTRAGSRCQEVVSSVDFYPTLLEMAGLAPEEGQVLDGLSLVPALKREGGLRREAIFCHFPHRSAAPTGLITEPGTWVRTGHWKLIRFYQTGPEFPNRYELYDLREDIGETRNLAEKRPEKVRELDALIEGFLARTGALVPRPNPAYDLEAKAVVDGWRPGGQCKLTQRDGLLRMESKGGDPQIVTDAVPEAAGALVVRFRMRSTSQGIGQLFWADEKTPQFGPTVRLDFPAQHDGEWHEYEVRLATQGRLKALRIDPSTGPGMVEFDWVRLCGEEGAVLREWAFDGA